MANSFPSLRYQNAIAMHLRFDSTMIGRTLLGCVLIAAALAASPAHAQSATKMRRIGVLDGGAPPTAEERQATLGPLRELGWVEGRNLVIEERFANGDEARLPALAQELAALKVEIIVSNGTAAALAAKAATRSIPIVMFSARSS